MREVRPTGRRNCSICTHWRPITDFPKTGKTYISHHVISIHVYSYCNFCKNAKKRAYMANISPKVKAKEVERRREWMAVQRRKRGVPVRPVGPDNKGKYGAGRTGNERLEERDKLR